MLATEYYWTKASEALAKADATELNYFLSIAIAYRALALGEDRFRRALPYNPPRHISPTEPTQTEAPQVDAPPPSPDATPSLQTTRPTRQRNARKKVRNRRKDAW